MKWREKGVWGHDFRVSEPVIGVEDRGFQSSGTVVVVRDGKLKLVGYEREDDNRVGGESLAGGGGI